MLSPACGHAPDDFYDGGWFRRIGVVQDLYATTFRVAGSDPEPLYERIITRAMQWAWRGPGAGPDVSEERSGERPEVNGYRLGWIEYAPEARAERAFELTLRHPDPQVEGREWRTVVDICQSTAAVNFTLRIAREAVELRMTPAALTTLRRPGLVPDLLTAFPCGAGELDVTALPVSVHVTGVEDFVDVVLRAEGRALPVIVIAPPAAAPGDPDPARVADELAGLAHVVVLGGHLAMRRFQEAVGDVCRVPPGGLRLFWPGFGRPGDELRHRYWTRRALRDDPTPIEKTLFALLSRISVHAVPLDPLSAELRRAVADERLRRLAAEGRSDAELLEMYAAENEELTQRVRELESKIEEQADELAAHRRNWEAMSGADHSEEDLPDEDVEAEAAFEPVNWAEFVEYLPLLEDDAFVITPHAKDGCSQSPYSDPARMWSHLERLSEAARDWAARDCSVGKDLKTWIQENYDGLEISLHDGGLGDRADFEFQRKRYSREPHVKVDDYKSPDECGRIYFAVEADEKRFIVDHIGLHL